jgi:hypothetical protein
LLADPEEDLPHDRRLRQDDFITRTALGARHVAGTERCGRQDTHPPAAGGVAFAAASVGNDLAPLVLGDGPLNLQQEIAFGAFSRFVIQKDNLDASSLQFADKQKLVGEVPCQAIGREGIEAVDQSGGSLVTQALQLRPQERRTGTTIIDKTAFLRDGKPIVSGTPAQSLDLAVDGAFPRLLLRGDTGVESAAQ